MPPSRAERNHLGQSLTAWLATLPFARGSHGPLAACCVCWHRGDGKPRAAAFACAGPVKDQRCIMTNLGACLAHPCPPASNLMFALLSLPASHLPFLPPSCAS